MARAYVRGADAVGVKVEGLDRLAKQFQNLGVNFPKRNIRRASNKGIKEPLKVARRNAPKGETGELKKGIVKIEEKGIPRKKKKVVFYIAFDFKKNDVFRKKINPETQGSRGGQTRIPFAYYPISVEYGFHIAHGVKTDGKKFIKDAIEQTQEGSLKTVIEDLQKSINQVMNKRS
jgi:hypothetical protein